MNYLQIAIFSLSILIAAAVGAIRIKQIDTTFYPFIFCTWLASINEIVSLYATSQHISTAYNNNIYVLAESLLITWQFKNWGFFRQNKSSFKLLMAILLVIWVLEYHSIQKLEFIGDNFRIIYSFLIVFMSIDLNNKLIYNVRGMLVKNPIFLICAGFILYFTFKIFIEAFLLYGIKASLAFYKDLFLILAWINLFTNILYAIALLCIPKKTFYTIPY